MAEQVAEFPTGRKKYLWDEWLDGQIWKLVRGEDFFISVRSMVSSAYAAGRPRGLKIKTTVKGDCLYIQAVRKEG